MVTTHYIEEATHANQVSFLYRGLCLEQNTPSKLLMKYDCSTLEECSYRVCHSFDKLKRVIPEAQNEKKSFLRKKIDLRIRKNHMNALIWKLFNNNKTNPLFLGMFFMLPVLAMLLPLISFGSPKNVPVAVHDSDQTNLTRAFVDSLDRDVMKVRYSDSVEKGVRSVKRAKNLMFAEIPEGFTERIEHFEMGEFDDDDMVEANDAPVSSTADPTDSLAGFMNKNSRNDSIKLYLDMANVVPGYYTVAYTFLGFAKALRKTQGSSQNSLEMSNMFAMKFEEPIYGSFDVEYKDSIACGQLIMLTVNCMMFLTAFMINAERDTGVKYRDRVTGITKLETVLSVFIYSLIVNLVIVLLEVVTVMLLYDNMIKSKLFESVLLVFLVGVVGALIGILLALGLKDKILIAVSN